MCTILIDNDLMDHDHWKSVLSTSHFNDLIVFRDPNICRSILDISHLFDLVFSDPDLWKLVRRPAGSPSDSPPSPSAFLSPCLAPAVAHGGR